MASLVLVLVQVAPQVPLQIAPQVPLRAVALWRQWQREQRAPRYCQPVPRQGQLAPQSQRPPPALQQPHTITRSVKAR